MLKILQARLQPNMNRELPDVQAGFRKGRGTRDQTANILWIIEKAREFQKNIYFYFIDYAKVFDSTDHNKLWKILKEMGIPGHLTCFLRNLYASQEEQLELDMEQKVTFSNPVATVEFSVFAGILSAALSQHHLSGFEIAQLECHH